MSSNDENLQNTSSGQVEIENNNVVVPLAEGTMDTTVTVGNTVALGSAVVVGNNVAGGNTVSVGSAIALGNTVESVPLGNTGEAVPFGNTGEAVALGNTGQAVEAEKDNTGSKVQVASWNSRFEDTMAEPSSVQNNVVPPQDDVVPPQNNVEKPVASIRRKKKTVTPRTFPKRTSRKGSQKKVVTETSEEKPVEKKKGRKKSEKKAVEKKGKKKTAEKKTVEKRGRKKSEKKSVEKKGRKKSEKKSTEKRGRKKSEKKTVEKIEVQKEIDFNVEDKMDTSPDFPEESESERKHEDKEYDPVTDMSGDTAEIQKKKSKKRKRNATPKDRKRKKYTEDMAPNNPYGNSCTNCEATVSAQWRRGPIGSKSLCNACGLKWHQKKLHLDQNGKFFEGKEGQVLSDWKPMSHEDRKLVRQKAKSVSKGSSKKKKSGGICGFATKKGPCSKKGSAKYDGRCFHHNPVRLAEIEKIKEEERLKAEEKSKNLFQTSTVSDHYFVPVKQFGPKHWIFKEDYLQYLPTTFAMSTSNEVGALDRYFSTHIDYPAIQAEMIDKFNCFRNKRYPTNGPFTIENLLHIFSFLSFQDCSKLATVCYLWDETYNSPYLWQHFYNSFFPIHMGNLSNYQRPLDWKDLFRVRRNIHAAKLDPVQTVEYLSKFYIIENQRKFLNLIVDKTQEQIVHHAGAVQRREEEYRMNRTNLLMKSFKLLQENPSLLSQALMSKREEDKRRAEEQAAKLLLESVQKNVENEIPLPEDQQTHEVINGGHHMGESQLSQPTTPQSQEIQQQSQQIQQSQDVQQQQSQQFEQQLKQADPQEIQQQTQPKESQSQQQSQQTVQESQQNAQESQQV